MIDPLMRVEPCAARLRKTYPRGVASISACRRATDGVTEDADLGSFVETQAARRVG